MYNKKPYLDLVFDQNNISWMRKYEIQEYKKECRGIIYQIIDQDIQSDDYIPAEMMQVVADKSIRPFHFFQEEWRTKKLTDQQEQQIREWIDSDRELEPAFIRFATKQRNLQKTMQDKTLSEIIQSLNKSQALLFLRLIEDGELENYIQSLYDQKKEESK